MKGQSLAIASSSRRASRCSSCTCRSSTRCSGRADAYYDSASGLPTCSPRSSARPRALSARIAAIPGVEAVQTRVVADVTLDVPGLAEPATGRLISVPAAGVRR